jgi:hypothetical protein
MYNNNIIEMSVYFSDLCSAGTYKANGMTTCETCPVGKESNKDKTACGKSVLKQLPQFSLRK